MAIPPQKISYSYQQVETHHDSGHNASSHLSPKRGFLLMEWFKEIVGMIASILAFLVVVAMAYKMQDRRLSDWSLPIAISTVVSALSVVSRSTIAIPVVSCISQLKWHHFHGPKKMYDMEVFDDASRGGLGALMLMMKMPTNLAAVGAMVTLLAYLLGPAYQQVIQLEEKEVVVVRNQTAAAFGFSHRYDTNISHDEFGAILLETVDVRMQGAVMEGLFGSSLTPSFNCSSKCSWDGSYTSFGFARFCRDVTSETLATKRCVRDSDNTTVPDTDGFIHSCRLHTPSNIEFFTQFVGTAFHTSVAVSSIKNDTRFTDEPPVLFQIARYTMKRNEKNDSIIEAESVEECTLTPAAYTYTGVTAKGNEINMGVPKLTTDLRPRILREFIQARRFAYTAPDIPEMIVAEEDLKVVTSFLDAQFFNRSIQTGTHSDLDLAISAVFAVRSSNLSTVLERVVSRMTDRVANAADNQVALGNTLENVVFVKVVYYWLVLPLLISVATLLLMVFTMWQSRASKRVALWKASSLALLYHYTREPENPANEKLLVCDVGDMEQLEKLAKETTVRKL